MDDKTYFRVPFDDETVDMLLKLSEASRRRPAALIAAIVRDVLADDAAHHSNAPIPGMTKH